VTTGNVEYRFHSPGTPERGRELTRVAEVTEELRDRRNAP
jgi:hypothetical protein